MIIVSVTFIGVLLALTIRLLQHKADLKRRYELKERVINE